MLSMKLMLSHDGLMLWLDWQHDDDDDEVVALSAETCLAQDLSGAPLSTLRVLLLLLAVVLFVVVQQG
jgi:hypothetical protein